MCYTITRLSPEEWRGKKLDFRYVTDAVYDVRSEKSADGWRLSLRRVPLDTPAEHSFTDTLLSPWLDEPFLLGAADERGEVLGLLEASHETWNNRLLVSNLLVMEGHRGQGVGRTLLRAARAEGRALGARMLWLETQSCNAPAIGFYLACGLDLIGLDLCCYQNDDVKRRQVRLNMGIAL